MVRVCGRVEEEDGSMLVEERKEEKLTGDIWGRVRGNTMEQRQQEKGKFGVRWGKHKDPTRKAADGVCHVT